jgi:predicted 3-demethylubiquinone-9 3-methyltransferase (glyoxalase superfamily)
MQKITPFLWFDGKIDAAIKFYSGIFKNFEILHISHYPDGAMMAAGEILTAAVIIEGQQINFLNGGPKFPLTPAISFMVNCSNQDEVDYYWNALSEGGAESMCGWLVDPFGLSWQIIPDALGKLMSNPDKNKAQKVMQAMLKMKKIVIADLEAALID